MTLGHTSVTSPQGPLLSAPESASLGERTSLGLCLGTGPEKLIFDRIKKSIFSRMDNVKESFFSRLVENLLMYLFMKKT